jgi:hypothetical protein
LIPTESVKRSIPLSRRSPRTRKSTCIVPVGAKLLSQLCRNEVWNEVDKNDANWLEITNDIISGLALGIGDVKELLLSLSIEFNI